MADSSQQFTVKMLKEFNGRGPGGKIYVAINGIVYDVTEKGKTFYGKGGPYAMFAGRDASRALATMDMTVRETFDDLSDLTAAQRESLNTWETQFKNKYSVVGTLEG